MPRNPEALVLAGGLGRRLEPITGGSIPKAAVEIRHQLTGLQLLLSQLDRIGVNATFSASDYYRYFEEEVKGTDHRMLWQKPGGVVEVVLQRDHSVLTLAPDCVFNMRQLPEMIRNHVPGTITWAVTRHKTPMMEGYAGCDVVDGAIIGRVDKSIVRSPVLIINPDLLRRFANPNPSDGSEGESLFFDVLPRIEEENYERIVRGKPSILNAFFLDGPVFDYGTPERLYWLTHHLDDVLYSKQNVVNPPIDDFFVYDNNVDTITGIEPREIVHVDGSWHRGVQLNIIHDGRILIQRRSAHVDLSPGRLDQSLATQLIVEDNEDEKAALRRGLEQELGLVGLKFSKIVGPVRIEKRYKEDPKTLNREAVSLYQATLPKRVSIAPRSPKVAEVFWANIEHVKEDAMKHPQKYTQTFAMWLQECM